MSRGFLAALAGIAMTLFAWFGPWAWPAWPAFTAIGLVFGKGGFSELPYGAKAITVVALIVLNVAFWAGVTSLVVSFFYGLKNISTARRARKP